MLDVGGYTVVKGGDADVDVVVKSTLGEIMTLLGGEILPIERVLDVSEGGVGDAIELFLLCLEFVTRRRVNSWHVCNSFVFVFDKRRSSNDGHM